MNKLTVSLSPHIHSGKHRPLYVERRHSHDSGIGRSHIHLRSSGSLRDADKRRHLPADGMSYHRIYAAPSVDHIQWLRPHNGNASCIQSAKHPSLVDGSNRRSRGNRHRQNELRRTGRQHMESGSRRTRLPASVVPCRHDHVVYRRAIRFRCHFQSHSQRIDRLRS